MGNRDWDHTCATRHMRSVCGVCKVIHVVCACSCKVGEPPEEKGVQKIQMASGNFLTSVEFSSWGPESMIEAPLEAQIFILGT